MRIDTHYILVLSLLAACQNNKVSDERVGSSGNGESANQVGFGEPSLDTDPSDPCSAEKFFGFSFTGPPATYIVGGNEAGSDDLVTRSTVKIYLGGGHCSGTLVGPSHIVTAAHCFEGLNSVDDIRIGIGTKGRVVDGVKAEGVIVHPEYKGILASSSGGYADQSFYDVAVVSISGNIGMGRVTYPAPIASTSQILQSGSKVIVAGYGAYAENDRMLRPLSVVETRVDQILPNFKEIQLEGGKGLGACYGDSGGPTYVINKSRSCLQVVGSTTGPGRNSDFTCDYGSGTMMNLTQYQGWIKCAFDDLARPLSYLAEDASASACSANRAITD